MSERYFQHSKIKFVSRRGHVISSILPILIQTPVSTDNGHFSVLRVNPALRTVFICALYTTEYLSTETFHKRQMTLAKVLSNIKSTRLSRQLKPSVLSKVTDFKGNFSPIL